jgi:hypothetical protein
MAAWSVRLWGDVSEGKIRLGPSRAPGWARTGAGRSGDGPHRAGRFWERAGAVPVGRQEGFSRNQ